MNLLRFIPLVLCGYFFTQSLHAQLPTVTDELLSGQSGTYCPPSGGSLDIQILFSSADADVDFFVIPTGNCVSYTGLRPGIDTALVEVCSPVQCDSILLIVTILDSSLPPFLQDDAGEVTSGNRLILALLDNDQTNAPITSYGLLDEGRAVQADLQADYSLSYFAPLESCGFTDQLSYYICTANGCDTARVTVTVNCPEVIVYNAVSPNGDDLNEVFFIEGISSFPDSELYIFNAQGSEVFRSTGYRNDWGGTTPDGRMLPSGTYYYRLRLNSELTPGRELSGRIELQR